MPIKNISPPGQRATVLMRGPGGEFEVPFVEAVFGGPARNESRHSWIQREGAEPVLVPDILRYGEKDKTTNEQKWEDVPAGSSMEGLLLPRPPVANRHFEHFRQKVFGRARTSGIFTLMPTTLDPRELRPVLHAKIDEMDEETLAVLHRVALELELERVTAEVDAGFDKLREDGRLERLPEIIREAREAIRARGAG